MAENHIIKVKYNPHGYCRTRSVFQYDYGQVLLFENFNDLPAVFEVHFAKPGVDETIPMFGEDNLVRIPDECVMQKQEAKAWLFLHDEATDGETKFVISIPVEGRNAITNSEPTEQEHDIISEAITILNKNVEDTEQARDRAIEAETNAETIKLLVEEAYASAEEAKDVAVSAAEDAAGSKNDAMAYAGNAETSAENAANTLSEVNDTAEQIQNFVDQAQATTSAFIGQAQDEIETSVRYAQAYAEQAQSHMRSAANSEANAAVSLRQAGEYASSASETKIDVLGLKNDVTNIKNDIVEIQSSVERTASEISQNTAQAAASASSASASAQEAQVAASSMVEQVSESVNTVQTYANTVQQSVSSAQEASRLANTYAIRAESAYTSAESASSRASTNASNANRYASNSRSYAASAEQYSINAEVSKNEAQEIASRQNEAIGPVESRQAASQPYAAGSFFVYDGKLYRATTNISKDETIIPTVNCALTTVAEQLNIIYQLLNP